MTCVITNRTYVEKVNNKWNVFYMDKICYICRAFDQYFNDVTKENCFCNKEFLRNLLPTILQIAF